MAKEDILIDLYPKTNINLTALDNLILSCEKVRNKCSKYNKKYVNKSLNFTSEYDKIKDN